jgi:cytochrome c-type biogenesis protein CcsB
MAGWEDIGRLFFMAASAAYLAGACFAVGQLYGRGQWLNQAVRGAIILGLANNGLSIAARAAASGRLPFADMYEFGIVFIFVTVVLASILEYRYGAYKLHAFVLPITVILAGTVLCSYHAGRPLVPALKSFWLIIHVVTAVVAYGALATSCAVATMYLWRERLSQDGVGGKTGSSLPSLVQLEMMADRLVSWAMPFLTLLIITGAIWAEYAWGTYWRWDPKETWSLITWVIYAIFLHGRRVLGWRGAKAMGLLIIGFVAVLITFVGINMLKSGLHAYF